MNREDKIIEIISKKNKVGVNELAEALSVSKVTIRKDLDKLEEKGIITRQHGFAVINNQNDIHFRLTQNYNLKRRIAKKAAEIINEGETVLIESGSTCALLAEELALSKKDITIITNSAFIASYIRKADHVKIILLGGEYQNDSQVTVGPLIKKVVSNFSVDKLFIGIDGFDYELGFMAADLMRSEATRYLAESANKTIVLTDSSKFERKSLVTEFEVEEVSMVFTDNQINKNVLDFLTNKNVKVVTVNNS